MNALVNICDSHIHVVGDQAQYPMVAHRRYTPPTATVADLQAHLHRMHANRVVIIQPSFYGFDNRCTMQAVADMSGTARAVVVLPEDVSRAELRTLDAQGARGVRLNIETGGHITPEVLQGHLKHWERKLEGLGWHIQLYAPLPLLVSCAETFKHLAVPCVFDHFCLWSDATCESTEAKALLDLLASGNIYLKLSASYRVPLESQGLGNVVKRLLQTRMDRLLWGTDWPHTNKVAGLQPTEVSPYRLIGPLGLVQERETWLGIAEARQAVLADNPARLYRF